jgi:hypothetical protein
MSSMFGGGCSGVRKRFGGRGRRGGQPSGEGAEDTKFSDNVPVGTPKKESRPPGSKSRDGFSATRSLTGDKSAPSAHKTKSVGRIKLRELRVVSSSFEGTKGFGASVMQLSGFGASQFGMHKRLAVRLDLCDTRKCFRFGAPTRMETAFEDEHSLLKHVQVWHPENAMYMPVVVSRHTRRTGSPISYIYHTMRSIYRISEQT